MNDIVFRTERLQARKWQETDINSILEVYSDIEAMRWVGDGSAITREECSLWMKKTFTNYQVYGYGMYALELIKETGVIGFCGIVHPGGQKEAEVKYALSRDYWGFGFATEAVQGLLKYGFKSFNLAKFIATIAPDNIASENVLLKNGFIEIDLAHDGDGFLTKYFHYEQVSV